MEEFEMDERERALCEEVVERLQKEYDEFQEALKYVRENIDYPFECIKEYLDDGSLNIHLGYFRVEKLSYGRNEQYSVDYRDYEDIIFDRQGDNDENSFHCLVCQMTVWEDNYHGYILFPLKDGRYWMVEYEC